jgi:hypothetical protein
MNKHEQIPLVDQLQRTAVMQQQEAVRGLKVFKVRTPKDDGWYFICAFSRQAAVKRAGYQDVRAATFEDLETIATRALTGNF